LQQYKDDLKGPKDREIIRKATVEKVEKAVKILKVNLEKAMPIVSLAKQVGLNQNLLQKGFNRMYNLSVNEYVRNLRLEEARQLLETTDLNVSEICYRIGLSSRSYFSKQFKEKYGRSPTKYRQQFHSTAAG
jgi:transcriptional regulator GlxA family with amidase domain